MCPERTYVFVCPIHSQVPHLRGPLSVPPCLLQLRLRTSNIARFYVSSSSWLLFNCCKHTRFSRLTFVYCSLLWCNQWGERKHLCGTGRTMRALRHSGMHHARTEMSKSSLFTLEVKTQTHTHTHTHTQTHMRACCHFVPHRASGVCACAKHSGKQTSKSYVCKLIRAYTFEQPLKRIRSYLLSLSFSLPTFRSCQQKKYYKHHTPEKF